MHRAKTALKSCCGHRHREKDHEDGVNVSIELDLCSQGCHPELLVILQLNAATLFSTAFSRCHTLSCRSDRSCQHRHK